MDCTEVHNLISADIDREIDANDRMALEAHLSTCAECRATSESLRVQDADLVHAFQPRRDAAARITEGVIDSLRREQTVHAHPRRTAASQWLSLILATAIGFTAAVLVLQPWKTQQQATRQDPVLPQPAVEAAIARLVVATGDVEVRNRGASEWQRVVSLEAFLCPTDTDLRTGPNVRCELETTDGCVIRLNDDSEVTLRSGRTVELKRGQIWCSSPQDVSLQVKAYGQSASDPKTTANNLSQQPLWALRCPTKKCWMTAVQNDGNIQVTTASGDIQVQTPSGEHLLKRGETARIVKGEVIKAERFEDPILAARWIHPLLMKKGHANEELQDRVDNLLARIGRTKLSMLYEREIRALGEYCVLPLLRFVQSPTSRDERIRRATAMRILSDIAPTWAISDLIELLSDQDAEVRFYSATALKRLTTITHDRSPEQWRVERSERAATLERWQTWWQQNRGQYPTLIPPSAFQQAPASRKTKL